MAREQGQLDFNMQQCIQKCVDCHHVCLQTINHCLSKGGEHAESSHIRLLMNCAEICQTTADFILTGSEYHTDLCEICTDLCNECADSCESVDSEDIQMKACADSCRVCADACVAVSGGTRKAA